VGETDVVVTEGERKEVNILYAMNTEENTQGSQVSLILVPMPS